MHRSTPKASRVFFALTPVALAAALLAALSPILARAQTGEPEPRLKASPRLREDIPSGGRHELPTFVSGEHVSGRTDLETDVEGHAELRRGDTVIRADRLEYQQPTDMARARGNVHINKAGNIFEGPYLELQVDSFTGFFNEPRYRFLRNEAYGEADRVDFTDERHAVVHNATYTTCKRLPGPSWMPDWILKAASIALDTEQDVGYAKGAELDFMGLPILPIPSMSFPLSDTRKSGVLPPTFGLGSVNGAEITLPYYWNIAPNRDATFYPTLMSKRGVDLGGEFRYLERDYKGIVRADYLPDDKLRDRDRWGYSVQHEGAVKFPGLPALGLAVNLNRVSDDNYWRDFSHSSAALTQRLLANDGLLTWSLGDFSLQGRVLKWQTLQDPAAPITPPYDRAPQFVATYQHSDFPGGLDVVVQADHTRFESEPALTLQPDARRAFVLAQVSRPWQAPGWFFIPKAQLHVTQYEFDAPLAGGQTTAHRTVPTFSLDGGLVFERDATFFGRTFRQTLEPRAFYVYTPFRDQNWLPNYDSARNDFNFATIYTENAFGGNDRIADNNLLTLGVNSRLLDEATGAEIARFGIAQRLRFEDQKVVLPGETPVSERFSDMLFGATLNWSPQWNFTGTVQYNPKTGRSERSTLGGSFHPGNYRVVSAAYRLERGQSEQIDVGWQWPLNDLWGDRGTHQGPGRGEGPGRWYSVGRLNFSMKDHRMVDSVVGLEYDGGCWIGRVVFERLQSGTTNSNTRVLFQLEFVGFSKLGSNALQALRENIPRYQFLREETKTPSRFTNYD
ncbi:MAG TPA: LPS-assembly protein LptD [Ramlibacter sp.]|uniref:LPS-assembly protein LptD n=1 Tax=Ramlibacter sp. TaxID=1917967 RepID=UPI002CE8F714|nr:LPS-assembly protein LptD [Ramlibacter sp.]HVZ46960.1 LPS-assembly protein LptD [Ramlibacter sp.]